MDAQIFEISGEAGGLDGFELALFATAMTASLHRFLAFRLLGEVGELVGAEQELLALGGISMTLGIGLVDDVLDLAFLGSGEEAAILLHLEEDFPSLGSQAVGEVLDII